MERRSARSSAKRKKYTVDAFEGIEGLQDARSDTEIEAPEDESSAEEFDIAAEPSSDVDDEMSGIEGRGWSDQDEGLGSDAGEAGLDDGISIADDDLKTPATTTQRRPTTTKQCAQGQRSTWLRAPQSQQTGPRTYTRGITEERLGRTSILHRRKLCFGSAPGDFEPAVAAQNRWAAQTVLPSRKEAVHGRGGMHASYYADDNLLEKAAEKDRKAWRKHGGFETLFARQTIESITHAQASAYIGADSSEAAFVMGTHDDQKLYKLPVGGSMSLRDASPHNKAKSQSDRPGFLLNVGAKVQCLEWAPLQTGPYQYLATAIQPKRTTDKSHPSDLHTTAFSPQPAYKSSIQIWRLKRQDDGSIDKVAGCKLAATLCTDWGDVKALKFCPMPLELSTVEETDDLGLLAGVFGDGGIRAVRLKGVLQDGEPTVLRLTQPAFQFRPSETVCACVTWLSWTWLAVGCANGFVAIWDLPASISSSSENPRPVVYTPISSSYILSISSCYPSRPHHLLATSLAGFTTITDISRAGQSLCSAASTVHSTRIRVAHRPMAWCDHLQLALLTEDSYILKGIPFRRPFSNFGLARAKSNITSLASSSCHPFLLFGSANGEVVSTNPIKRTLDNKPQPFQWTWFGHEWRRSTPEEAADGNCGGGVGANGLSRILEGFKLEHSDLRKDDVNHYKTHNGVMFATVYEEASAVTALAWNPNLHVGGWAAAGMGSGLVRIEDLAI